MCLPKKLIWIFGTMLVQNVSYSLIAPFLSLKLKELGMNETQTALVFCAYAAAVIIWSPIISDKLLPKFRASRLIAVGMFMLGFANTLYGLVDFMPLSLTVWYCIVLRILSGMASSTVQTTCYAVGTNDFSDRKELVTGGVEVVTGLANIIGPLFAAPLYQYFGFAWCFVLCGTLFIVCSFVILVGFPTTDEMTDIDDNFESFSQEYGTETEVRIGTLMKDPRFVMAAFGSSLSYFQFAFIEPILAPELATNFGLSPIQISRFFIVLPCFSIVSCTLAVTVLPKRIEKRAIIIVAAWCGTLGFLCLGPSKILNFPDKVWLMAVGMAITGVFNPLAVICGLPEMVESAVPKYDKATRHRVTNLSSGIFNGMLGFG